MAQQSIWLDFIECLKILDKEIPAEFPPELPSENDPNFWLLATKLEMQARSGLSTKIRALIETQVSPDFSKLECWLYRRRTEWAGQVALVKVKEGVEPNVMLAELLVWGLVTSWENAGCISMWNHMERGGQPHPKNPDGLSPT
jgi:hypothetical protein